MALAVQMQRGPSWSHSPPQLMLNIDPSISFPRYWLGLACPRSRGRSKVLSQRVLVSHSRYTSQARITQQQHIQHHTITNYWLFLIRWVGLATWLWIPLSGTTIILNCMVSVSQIIFIIVITDNLFKARGTWKFNSLEVTSIKSFWYWHTTPDMKFVKLSLYFLMGC
jgi:hypothetical protein